MKHRLILTIAMSFITLAVIAQGTLASRYNLTNLNLASGLSNNFVDDIFQDSNGFMWLSTHGGGLVRYDGYSLMNLGLSNDGIQLRSNASRNACEDKQQRLWIAFEEGFQVLDLRTLHPTTPLCTETALSETLAKLYKESCVRVYCDTKGCVWLVLQTKICRLAFDKEGRVNSVSILPHHTRYSDIPIRDVYEDGTVVTNFNSQIARIIPNGNSLLVAPVADVPQQANNRFVTDILKYHGALWIATTTGLFNNRKDYNVWHAANTVNSLQHDYVSSLAISPDDRLLIGTLGGVDILDDKTGMMEHWNSDDRVNPLSSDFVNCLYVANNQIWVGTEASGVVKLSPRRLNITNYLHHDNPTSLSPNCVNAMYAEPNGTLWVGTVEGGLNRKAKGSDEFEHFTAANSDLPHNTVSALKADGNGRLWIGTWGGGIAWLALGEEKAPHGIPVRLECDVQHRPLLTFIGALEYDKVNNGLWIGANEGIFFYNFKTDKIEDPFKECRQVKGCIGSLVTLDGKLLMGCVQGMVEVDLHSRKAGTGTFRHQLYRNKLDQPDAQVYDKITSFCQAHDGTVWAGSATYGFYRLSWDAKGQLKAKAYSTQDGLANDFVKGIVEDRTGMLWIVTDYGLSLFNPKTQLFNNFSEADGLVSSQFYYNGAVKDASGTLYLGTTKGMVALRGVSSSYTDKNINLRFTRLMVDNQFVYAGSGYLDTDISLAEKIHLHESDRSFTIEFSALNYGSEAQGVYSYRMKGFENEWTLLQPGQHSVRYSTLPSGNYQFEVRYSPSIGTDGEKVISIAVRVSPYFWKSWWFLSLVFVVLIIAVRYIYLKRLEQVRIHEVELLYKPIESALKDSDDPGKLQQRIQSILKTQERYHESQVKTVEADKEETTQSMRPFIDKVVEVIEKNYQNSEFGVTELSDALGMNRSALSKRLNAETGYPTSQFIRNYRLDIAKKMIEDNVGNRNITEIAYRVGFNDPKYFTRCFTKQFGVAPSAFMEK